MTWKEHIDNEGKKAYFLELKEFIKEERKTKTIVPNSSMLFNCFKHFEFQQTRVVIIGPEPYADTKFADGLCWSSNNTKQTLAMKYIIDEIVNDWAPNFRNNLQMGFHTNSLLGWAKQGILLLNARLTTEQGKKEAHENKGWETFTENTLRLISSELNNVVFILWGTGNYKKFIDTEKHLILESSIPTAKANNTFKGCKHFSETSRYLNETSKFSKTPINWFIINN